MSFRGSATKWSGERRREGRAAHAARRHQAAHADDRSLDVRATPAPRAAVHVRWDPRGSIKRSDFGMKFGVGTIGDEVKLWIGMEAFRNSTEGASANAEG